MSPRLFANGWREDDDDSYAEVATVGHTYSGEETGNKNFDIYFSPLDIPSGSAKNFDYTTYGTFEKAIKDAKGKVIHDTYALKTDLPTKTSQLTNDSGYAVISNGHLVINGSELWLE